MPLSATPPEVLNPEAGGSIMLRGKLFTEIILLGTMLMTASLFGAGTHFTNVANDPASGLNVETWSAGIGILDVNNDGFDDIAVAGLNSFSQSQLYLSNGDGTFTNIAASAGVSSSPHALSLATADMDISGFTDMLMFTEGNHVGYTYLNNGDLTFTDAAIAQFSIEGNYDGFACAFVDYDRDGLLDIFYAGRLFRNEGNMNYRDVNDETGLGDIGFVVHAAFADIDNDLDADFMCVRQHGPSSLYINNGDGTFSDATDQIHGITNPYGLAASFADIDNDGDLDMFLSFSNIMFYNDGTGNFTIDHDCEAYGRYTRGSLLADFDNDGDPDLVLCNEDGSSSYFENFGDGVFTDVTFAAGMDNGVDKGTGVAAGDFDGDGDLDLYLTNTNYRVNSCFFNDLNNTRMIEVTPRGTVSNYPGFGTKVYIYKHGYLGNVNFQVGMNELISMSGIYSSTNGRIHLGTGMETSLDVRTIFPSGIIVDTTNVSPGSRLVIYESGEAPNFIYAAPGAFNLTIDASDPAQAFDINLTDSKEEGVSWQAECQTPWITLLSTSGSTPGVLNFTVDPFGLDIDQYSAVITITSDDVFNSPKAITVNLRVSNYFLQFQALDVGFYRNDHSFAAAFFDYNLDGFDDIFVNNISGQCFLYKSDGSYFTDQSEVAGVDAAFHNLGLFGGDLDGDNLPDLLTFTEDRTVGFTYINTGFETFVDVAIPEFSIAEGYFGYAVAVADIDNDGDLDVFYGSKLLRNDGNLTYVDISAEAGLTNIGFVSNVTFGDIDGDNDMDMTVSQQNGGATYLFRNDGTGHFEAIFENSDLGYFPNSVGVSLGDVDNDGDLDMYLAAGFSRPNYLFINDGGGFFTDNTEASGTSNNNYSRGSGFLDIDNDGDLDLVLANENRSSQLYLNDGTGLFSDVTDICGINMGLDKATSVISGDYDNDGDLDIYVTRSDFKFNSFFENTIGDGNFISVKPVGIVSSSEAIGTKMYLYPAGQLGNPDELFAFRQYLVNNGFNASGINRVHFGTGTESLFDLRVIFPSGVVVDQTDIVVGSQLTVIESGEIPDNLVLIPSSLNFTFQDGDDPVQTEMTVKNLVGNPIPWTATVADNWCSLSSSSGTTDETITITIDPTGVNPGYHETTITVTADDAYNSPRFATVRMTIASNEPVLAVSTNVLNFIGEQGGYSPWDQAFTITNVGQGTIDWSLETTGQSWLSVSPQAGTAPTDVTVICHTGGMGPGNYTATVTVSAPGALNNPAQVTINLEIVPGDVPERDTLRVESISVQPGQQFALPVYLHNIEELAAFTLPLKYDQTVLTCDSVSFVGTRIEYLNITESNIDNENGKLLLGMVVFLEEYLQPGDGRVADLFFSVNAAAEEQLTMIDSAFFPPGGELMLFDPASVAIHPEFVHGNVYVAMNMGGDANGSGDINIADGVYLINYIFKGQRPPVPVAAGDANSDTDVNVGDVVYLINFIFRGGPEPGSAKRLPATSSPVYYTLSQIAEEDGNRLSIDIDSDIELGGLQIEISDPVGFLNISNPDGGILSSNMEIIEGHSGTGYKFGLVSMDGSGFINSGQGSVFSATYSGTDQISISSIHLFDSRGNEVALKYGLRPTLNPLPARFDLSQNYPNPFNPVTTIKYAMPSPGHVRLTVINILGQQVKQLIDTEQSAGLYEVVWDGTNSSGNMVASGVYFYKIKTESFTETKKMVLLK